jgi:MYXO-CTERM domain-containing protein
MAQDAVPCEGGAPGGGDVSELGECDGTDAIFCSRNGTIVRVPCAALFQGAPVGTCEVYDGFGSWCAFNDGDACAFRTQDGDTQFFACANDTSGCVDGVCTPNVGSCTPSQQGNPPACKNGTQIDAGCFPWGQSLILSCDEGQTCERQGVCTGAQSGDQCLTGVIECAAGLACNGENAATQTPGTCGTPGGEGEGEGEDDTGGRTRDEPEPAPSGCLSNASGSFPAFGVLALAILGLRRRR